MTMAGKILIGVGIFILFLFFGVRKSYRQCSQ